MTPEEMAADKARKDADEKTKADADAKRDAQLDKILSGIDSVGKRMDAFEAKDKERCDAEKAKADAEAKAKADAENKDDPEKVAADKAKKDADEKEASEKKERDDKAKKDAEEQEAKKKADSDVAKRIADVEAMVRPMSDTDRGALADAQSRADSVFQAFGKPAPKFTPGESVLQYRRRLATELKPHSERWKNADLGVVCADSAFFETVESDIYNDAVAASMSPDTVEGDTLRMVARTLPSGHRENRFVGRPSAWMNRFAGNRTYVNSISDKRKEA